jgi:hypothetical protein
MLQEVAEVEILVGISDDPRDLSFVVSARRRVESEKTAYLSAPLHAAERAHKRD